MLTRLGTWPAHLILIALGVIIFLNILVAWFHYTGLKAVPPESRKFNPTWAWIMVLPIVHTVFIWLLSAFKLPASYQAALGDEAKRFGTCNRRLGLAWAIVATTLFLPVVDILSFVAYVVLMILYWLKLNRMRRYLEKR
jgi:cobalamin synthase